MGERFRSALAKSKQSNVTESDAHSSPGGSFIETATYAKSSNSIELRNDKADTLNLYFFFKEENVQRRKQNVLRRIQSLIPNN